MNLPLSPAIESESRRSHEEEDHVEHGQRQSVHVGHFGLHDGDRAEHGLRQGQDDEQARQGEAQSEAEEAEHGYQARHRSREAQARQERRQDRPAREAQGRDGAQGDPEDARRQEGRAGQGQREAEGHGEARGGGQAPPSRERQPEAQHPRRRCGLLSCEAAAQGDQAQGRGQERYPQEGQAHHDRQLQQDQDARRLVVQGRQEWQAAQVGQVQEAEHEGEQVRRLGHVPRGQAPAQRSHLHPSEER